jgi:LmbE family N-acetylglucosaminyl deacetylase
MSRGVRLLAVRAHPDDESSATGGILARYAALGVPTGVVICTRGEEGEIHDPDLDPEEAKPRLGDIRVRELEAACQVLGVQNLHVLGYRDSGMRDEPSNAHPAAFCNADLVEAAGRLVRIIREWQPQVVVTDNVGGGYGHPDHVMCHHVTVRAFQAAGDPTAYPEAGAPWNPARLYVVVQVGDRWERLAEAMRQEGLDTSWLERRNRHGSVNRLPAEAATAAIDVSPYVDVQREALLRHRTQIPMDSYWVNVPPKLRPLAFGTAYFVRLHPAPLPGETDPDLFHGLD